MGGILFGTDKNIILSSVDLVLARRIKTKKRTLNFLECGCASGHTSLSVMNRIGKGNFEFNYYGIDTTELTRQNPVINNKKFKFIKGFTFQVSDQIPKDLDWIFIDACHCAMCVQHDAEIYAPFLSSIGVLVFHDASPRFQGQHPQTYESLKPYHNHEEAKKGIQVVKALSKINFKKMGLLLWEKALNQEFGGVQVYVKSKFKSYI